MTIYIYIDIVMSIIEGVSIMSKSGCSDMELLEYINEHFDEIECELNGDEYKEPKKHKRNFCIDCNLEMLIDYERSTLVFTKCGVFEYYPVHVQSYNHTMRYSRRKCIYKIYITNTKRSHTQLDSRKQVIAFQDRVMTINIKEAQHPLK